VDDKTTVFIGGSNDPFAIVTLDWSSMEFIK
jgi:hypothetical protein